MNATYWGVVVSGPDGSGMAQVSFGGATRSVFVDPLVWNGTGGYAVPVADDRVAVTSGWPTWVAIRPLGAGAAVGVAGGAWTA